MSLAVQAPLAGTVVPLGLVPDPVFSAGLLGPGTALDPRRDAGGQVVVRAPVAGTVTKLHPHAFVVMTRERSILVHLGLDTVTLEGRGFTTRTQEGAGVDAGAPMVSWSPAAVEAAGLNPLLVLIALDGAQEDLALSAEGTVLEAGETAFTWG
ncbi:MAG: PTS glucose transporter subunit IIA [Actinomyces sp.]|uniref:PTS sugar transporter subunit IIA n=1 Tax=Actinomyces sp. TaxID=29317 RepID=UPI0026DA9076|nr:PTS glucose transporter subunit IIA [Actinomyces sp.]MDO4243197.1 PTS glucose transporter subunit IIA [Actinomyces sp.]